MLYREFLTMETIAFDNETEAEIAAAEAQAAADAAAAAVTTAEAEAQAAADAALKATEKTFTQKDVDEIVVKRQKSLKSQFEKLEASYTDLLDEKNLSSDQRAALEADLENVQAQMRTKEQQLEHDKKKSAEQHKVELGGAIEERDFYRSLYQNSTIERAIADAAMDNDGYDTSQFVSYLGPRSKIVDELNGDGEKTGKLVPRVEWEIENDAGDLEIVLKTPREVVELMKDNVDKFGNMFKNNVARGVGEGSAAGQGATTGTINHGRITTEEFMKLRKDPVNRRAMGLDN